MMTQRNRVLSALCAALLFVAPAAAEEPVPPAPDATAAAEGGVELHYTVETSVASTYVFRGVPQYLGKTDPSSQSTLGLSVDNLGPGSLSFSLWNATALTDFSDQPGTKLEIDVTLGYAVPLSDRLEASIGYIGYLYPEADPVDGAHEIAAALSYASDIVTPTVAVFGELVRLKGVYALLGLSRDFAAGPITVTPSASVAVSGYEEVDFGDKSTGWAHLIVGFSK